MPTISVADPSTRPLSEVARHLVIPSGVVDTLWFDVEERCREFGDEFDPWQDGLGQVALGLREDGLFAATIGGITLSIPRQVAKTFIVMRIVVALCTLFPNLTVIWTAHRTRTATHAFGKMKALVMQPAVRAHLQTGSNQGTAIRDANGEQQIPFKNGSVIMFGAREQGFGRGFDEVDIEVFDEAQILTEKALEDMVAATNQSRFPHGALLFYMGTPPRPSDPGEVFELRRDKAIAVADRRAAGEDVEFDALYVECSADPIKARANPNDREQWAIANPSFPLRTPLTSMLRLRENLPSDDSWLREALGVWDDDVIDNPFAQWDLYGDKKSMASAESLRLALDAPPTLTSATFSIAGIREDGLLHVSVRYHVPPHRMGELVDLAAKLTSGHGVDVIVAANSPAKAWIADFEAKGIPVDKMTAADAAAAFGNISTKVRNGLVRHRNQPEMNNAVDGLTVRKSGEVDVPARRTSSANIAPFIGAMCALYRVPVSAETTWTGSFTDLNDLVTDDLEEETTDALSPR